MGQGWNWLGVWDGADVADVAGHNWLGEHQQATVSAWKRLKW